MIKFELESLLLYGLFHEFYAKEDVNALRGSLCEALKIPLYDERQVDMSAPLENLGEILSRLTRWASDQALIASRFPPYSDLFDTMIMGILCPKPSEVTAQFRALYEKSSQAATQWYYGFSKATNYIRMERMAKNVEWNQPTAYGEMIMTINLSKPEKDPKAIAEAANIKETGFPKCLLCVENVGYAGNINQPPRQNHRIIPLTLADSPWVLQYSPYIYYNEHAIVINQEHVPMAITRDTFVRLCDFVTQFEHYFIGSNADLPLVGGSMLTHDHYQAGCFDMPMAKATVHKKYVISGYETVQITWLKWPLTVLRLSSREASEVIALADKITNVWRSYTSATDELLSHTHDEPHHTVTPIARKRQGYYEMDVVLRDNRRSERYPDGIYHPHAEIHPVKKENIGLIEVMGLAVLPSRLKDTVATLTDALEQRKNWMDIESNPLVAGFEKIYERMVASLHKDQAAIDTVKTIIGQVFVEGLEHSGIMGITESGEAAMDRFIKTINEGEAF
jgi:UDPglucose--hexose-1-phosphate uridylyltransferase